MIIADVKAAVIDWFDADHLAIEAAQEAYLASHGRYQHIENYATIDLSAFGADPATVAVDEYMSQNGPGWVLRVTLVFNGLTYVYCTQHGPETQFETGWMAIDDES